MAYKLRKYKGKTLKHKRKTLKHKRKTLKHKRKLINGGQVYKGGSYNDIQFKQCYDKNINYILNYIKTNSGIHTIDSERANIFINNQKSQVRRDAARDLIDNSIYITLEEVSDVVAQLIVQLYSLSKIQQAINNGQNIYFYSGETSKSFYFINVLALYFIRKNNFPDPIFIEDISNLFDTIGNAPLIILDDVSYSGSQMSNLLNKIYYDRVINLKQEVPNITLLLIALSNHALKVLSEVYTKKDKYGTFSILSSIKSPFEILYLRERLYPDLVSVIGPERYAYVNLFFSIFTQRQPYLALYLDHKIADPASTYMRVFTYGPIIPSNYKEQYLWWLYNTDYTFISSQDEMIIKNNNNKKGFFKLIQEESFDVIDTPENNQIDFSPFINNCFNSNQLEEIINNETVKNMEYLLFMIFDYEEFAKIISYDEENVGEGNMLMRYISEKNINKKEIIDLLTLINSYKCPSSFYKKIKFQENC